MSLFSVFVVNTAPGCDNSIEQQLSVTGCTCYIIRLASNSNAIGPFNVYAGEAPTTLSAATLYYSGKTRDEMLDGVPLQLGDCVTPTPTPTPTITPTSETPTPTPTSETPTPTPTPSVTPNVTPTATETPTPTPSLTPSSQYFALLIQSGDDLLLQDGSPLLIQ